jgi:hypothetical protein
VAVWKRITARKDDGDEDSSDYYRFSCNGADQTYTAEMMDSKLIEAGELVDLLKKTVSELDDGSGLSVLVDRVCDRLKMPMLKSNPLFGRTIECLRQEA